MNGRPSAGHGVHRSFSESRVGAAPCGRPSVPSHGRPHLSPRKRGGGAPTAKTTIGVHLRSSAVKTPSSAGHGLHPSEIRSRKSETTNGQVPAQSPSGRRSALLSSVFCRPSSGLPAGHGVHRAFFDSRPALR
jgi:hypothetical protein